MRSTLRRIIENTTYQSCVFGYIVVARCSWMQPLSQRRGTMDVPEGLKGLVNSVLPLEKSLFKNTNEDIMDSRHGGFTFVGGSGDQPIEYPVRGYYSDGTLALMLGLYGIWSVNGQPRAYTGCNGAWSVQKEDVIAKANSDGRDGLIYLIMIPNYGIARSVVPGERNGACQ